MKPARPKSRRRVLGLAVGDKSMLIAEVMTGSAAFPVLPSGEAGGDPDAPEGGGRGRAFDATRLAEFVYPEAVGLDQGEALGEALAQFLRSNGFSTRHAVVGIPAKWVVVKPKQVPPADPSVVAQTLRLQAEGEFSQGLSDLVYDYAGQGSEAESRQVLLMATPKRYVDQLLAIGRGARLDVAAVTPSAAALAWATSRSGGTGRSNDALVLVLGAAGAEFTAQCGSSPCALRHLGPMPAIPPGPAFLSELRRSASLLPAVPGTGRGSGGNGEAGGAGTARGRELVIWNGFSTDLAARKAVGESLGIPVRAGDLASLGVSAADGESGARSGNPGHFAPAIALALSGLAGAFAPTARDQAEPDAVPADFLHPRLAPPEPKRVDRRVVWGVALGVALLALAITLIVQQNSRQSELNAINSELTRLKPDITEAKSWADRVAFARGWHSDSPLYISCLTDLTTYMPDDRQTFVTNFDLHYDKDKKVAQGTIQGTSTAQQNVQRLVNSLTASGRFADVDSQFSTRTIDRGGATEVTFTIKFTYKPKE